MVKNLEDMQKFGKDNVDATLKSFGVLSKSLQTIATEMADYSKKAFEEGAAATEKLIGAKSLDKAFEVQSDYVKNSYEGFVAQATKLAVVTQTTLSVDDAAQILAAVKRRFPNVREPKQQDICYATQNRQDAVKVLAPQVDVLVVVGSPTSSNSNRLRELAERLGTPAYMVDAPEDLRAEWFEGKARVGLTAGASAPDILVQHVIERLRALGAVSVRKMPGVEETTHFPLPKGLGDKAMGLL